MRMQQLKSTIKEILEPLNGCCSVVIECGGERIELNSYEKCEAASLIKIPILLETYRQYQRGTLDLEARIEVRDDQKVGGSGVLSHLSSGLKLTLKDLLTLMITVSDNTATNLVINLIGKDSVNRLCAQLGCEQTSLQRNLFDQRAIKQGKSNYTSAKDMLICLHEIAHGSLLNEKYRKETVEMLAAQQLSAKLPHGVIQHGESDPFIAHKTGEVRGVEHDVGIIRHNHQEILVAVLTYDLADNAVGRKIIGEIGQAVILAAKGDEFS